MIDHASQLHSVGFRVSCDRRTMSLRRATPARRVNAYGLVAVKPLCVGRHKHRCGLATNVDLVDDVGVLRTASLPTSLHAGRTRSRQLSHHRRAFSSKHARSLSLEGHRDGPGLLRSETFAERHAWLAEVAPRFGLAFNGLREQQRVLVGGLPWQRSEFAEILGPFESTVQMGLHRRFARLRSILAGLRHG